MLNNGESLKNVMSEFGKDGGSVARKEAANEPVSKVTLVTKSIRLTTKPVESVSWN